MEATGRLFSKVKPDDLASALGLKRYAITLARSEKIAREPPAGWEDGVIACAKARIRALEALIADVEAAKSAARVADLEGRIAHMTPEELALLREKGFAA